MPRVLSEWSRKQKYSQNSGSLLTAGIKLHGSFYCFGFKVWNLKTCSVCTKDKRNKSELFIHHMMPILKHLKDKGAKPIMWDDMMRKWPVEYLKGRTSLVNLLNREFKNNDGNCKNQWFDWLKDKRKNCSAHMARSLVQFFDMKFSNSSFFISLFLSNYVKTLRPFLTTWPTWNNYKKKINLHQVPFWRDDFVAAAVFFLR